MSIVKFLKKNSGMAKSEIRSFVKHMLYQYGLHEPQNRILPGDIVDQFVNLNKVNWVREEFGVIKDCILIEGHLANYGPNYLVRTAVAAKKIQQFHHLPVVVLFPGYPHDWQCARKLYESFGITHFIYTSSMINPIQRFYAFISSQVLTGKIFLKLKSPKDLVGVTIDDIPVGDLIYDDMLRYYMKSTIEHIDLTAWVSLSRATGFWSKYKQLFKKIHVKFLVSTHLAYSEYGMLVRYSLLQGATVIETNDTTNTLHNSICKDNLPTYHQGIKNMLELSVRRLGSDLVEKQRVMDEASANLDKRIVGELSQIDVSLAYKGKQVYTDSKLRKVLNIDNDKPFVFIFAHIFNDSPHTSSWLMYQDYYVWLVETLKIAKTCTQTNWLVKPHPAAGLYNEDGEIERLVREMQAENIYIVPDDLSPSSVINCGKAIVTVQGTVAIEYACMGIPAIITGNAFYSGYGFTIEPKSEQEYAIVLRDAFRLKSLDEQQVDASKLIYGLWCRLGAYSSGIIDQEILSHIWGYGGKRDLNKAYDQLLVKMKNHSLAELDIAKFVSDFCA